MAWIGEAHGREDREERYDRVKDKLSDLRARIMEEWDLMDACERTEDKDGHREKIDKLRKQFADLSEIFKELWPDD